MLIPRQQIKFNVEGQELVVPLDSTAEDVECEHGYTTEVVRRIIAAKDQGRISDKAYHELQMAFPDDVRSRIPPLSTILQERKLQNKDITVIPIPEVRTACICSLLFVG